MSSKTPPDSSPPDRIQVKKENEETEIKDFAETAMNELLGWYGYERLELRRWAASRAKDAASPEQSNEQKSKDECSWCNKGISSDGGSLQQAGAAFCSELCFSQSRRANFKRAKTCDWCRHVRHTVAYVDFQDGATQLQFCSDKCLNQYKMHIFCRETQAHLDLNPHLVNASSSSNLITPDLWLKNCKSRSPSPTSERSGSPNVENTKVTESIEGQKPQRKSPLPVITIAPTAKLMKPKRNSEERAPLQKSPEAKKDVKANKMNLRKRRSSKCSATVTSQTVRHNVTTPKAQDLRMCSPSIDGSSPTSTVGMPTMTSPPHSLNAPLPPPPFPNPMFGMPPSAFMENPGHMNDYRLPNMFPPRPAFIPRPGMPIHHERSRLPPPMSFPTIAGQAPPVTVLVPYPVVLPIPLPIPVPIPLASFLQAYTTGKLKTDAKTEEEGPLDFTMNNDKKNEDKEENNSTNNESIKESSIENIIDRIEDRNENVSQGTGNPEQTLPKFKITRLGNKMSKIVSKSKDQSESMRPLRKRRRLVDVVTDEETLIPKTRKIVQV